MALPVGITPEEHAKDLSNQFVRLKVLAEKIVDECNTGTIQLGPLLKQSLQNLIYLDERVTELSAISGVGAAYEARYPTTFTFSTELTAVQTAVGDCIDYIVSTIPKDSVSDRWLLVDEFDQNYKLVSRTVSTAGPINTLKSLAQAIITAVV